ncbi:MAG: AAA family ATPase, partial [Candidatus Geothermincolia bacterium]
MFLRSLTIKGFKSFARKTVLEFEPGVTIIVGPNGSGKSNIADAVMWVLGEQSPTSLRGNRMEDVIFSGSSSLRPVNMAEVSLTLDNSNNDFPLEYSEVIVTRNVVRGGDSEYRLNNSACRLLDIQELLSDAGVGRTLNSVISQGNLDDVLTCRPEERRDYIEEAGGLLKYRKRREKAIRRLARMDEEILRTNDVAREVRRQLRPLQRQAGRLEQYQTLVSDLNQARIRLDVANLRAMQREWQAHEDSQRER